MGAGGTGRDGRVQHVGKQSEVVPCVQGLRDREVAVYSISCKSQNNIDITIAWLTAHSK